MPNIASKKALIAYVAEGNPVKYLCFWGHTPKHTGHVGKECLSQWCTAGFDIDDIHYPGAEHYMMAEKARLFGDSEALAKILNSTHPGEAKKLGRMVQGYQDVVWKKHRFEIVVRGNQAKFSQNEALRAFLLNSGQRVLVEASPRDRIWGIGLGENNPDTTNPAKWSGLNLLGLALMEVRNGLD